MKAIIYLFGLLFIGCATPYEARLMFSNIDYNAMSIRPLSFSNDDFAFRLYANNGSSLDRIITLSVDTMQFFADTLIADIDIIKEGDIKYIGTLFYEKNNKSVGTFQSIQLDRERASKTIDKLKEMNLFSYEFRDTIPLALHTPFSTYVIEIKNGKQYHSFRFATHYPTKTPLTTKYEKLEKDFFEFFPEFIHQMPRK